MISSLQSTIFQGKYSLHSLGLKTYFHVGPSTPLQPTRPDNTLHIIIFLTLVRYFKKLGAPFNMCHPEKSYPKSTPRNFAKSLSLLLLVLNGLTHHLVLATCDLYYDLPVISPIRLSLLRLTLHVQTYTHIQRT